MGLEQFRTVAPHSEPLDAVDLDAVLAGDSVPRDPARLVDVVAGRIGDQAVYAVAPVESHSPERAVARVDPVAATSTWPGWARPVRLLPRPEPLSRYSAIIYPEGSSGGADRTRSSPATGPSVHGEWWRRDAEVWAVRDYYRFEDEAGGRYLARDETSAPTRTTDAMRVAATRVARDRGPRARRTDCAGSTVGPPNASPGDAGSRHGSTRLARSSRRAHLCRARRDGPVMAGSHHLLLGGR